MQRFKMTSDGFHTWTPIIVTPLVVLPLVATFGATRVVAHPAVWIGVGSSALVLLILIGTTMLTPTAVRLTVDALEVERLAWPAFRVPISELVSVEEGPVSKILAGDVGRVAGVGGWFWSGGLFRARGVGNVRAWLRRLGPTVVVRRKAGLPLLFGLDDPEGLRAALQRRL